mmetsp:Transcript_17989/g.51514  ORF Transcript_17989/g.51514 Transcript_17989/m.51514 type:complete len:325 (+) Transcript_17989:93-1067(+)|eukprot:CAMPEP_0181052584 /NCGR_PEP_ID=MMETSP1070-20121207/17664_1 /TAXON_ID=265543 /ORGANISM="Minutocellus polymorphus, Strain NH13" /LENGTH=324 /DNA_ID=CAMNT_0023131679 /DNA_START=59 /DNA_END=1033 /DNA_ORIENTATION=+
MSFNEIFLLVALILPAVRETVAFGPGSVSQFSPAVLAQKSVTARQQPKQQWNGKDGTVPGGTGPLGMVMDPYDAMTHAQAAADLLHDHGHHVTSHAESAITTITTSDVSLSEAKYHPEIFKGFGTAAKPHDIHYKWELNIGKWHFHLGNKIFDGVEIDGSVPPGFGDTADMEEAAKYKDFFIPEDKAEQLNAVKRQSAATLGEPSLNSELLRDRTPGGKPEFFFDTPMDPKAMYAPLSAKDLDEIAHDGDIMSRLPMIAFASVLIDFFFFNSGNDIYRDEIVNDDEALRSEWVAQVVPRLGIGIVVALATMWSSYTFYHPIPGV